MISALSNCALQQIVDNVKNGKYYSLILDGTIDISRIDQCPLSIRYVNTKGRAEEHFISSEELEGRRCSKLLQCSDEQVARTWY